MCFGLFGKAFRGISKPLLVNSVNGSGTLVEIEFNIGSKEFLVRRGIKPNVFEIYVIISIQIQLQYYLWD